MAAEYGGWMYYWISTSNWQLFWHVFITLKRLTLQHVNLTSKQSDQIGKIFSQWMIVFYGQFSENYKSGPNFGATFVHGKSSVLTLTKYELGYIFGDFFTYSSGHSASKVCRTNIGRKRGWKTNKSCHQLDSHSIFSQEKEKPRAWFIEAKTMSK
jgi:hypothetical protein